MWLGKALWCHVCESALERQIETKTEVHLKIKGQDAIRGMADAGRREERETGGMGREESGRKEGSGEGERKEEIEGKGRVRTDDVEYCMQVCLS